MMSSNNLNYTLQKGNIMKTIDKYLKFKEMYKDHVVIIKSGNFYYTFLDDTYILNYFFAIK